MDKRLIEFRVYNTYTKKYQTLQATALKGDIIPYDNKLETTTNYPLILEQYTGLKDKNGNKIFEGDVVESNGVKLGVVEYFDREAGYGVGDSPLQAYVYGSALPIKHRHAYVELQIISNIHEEGYDE